MSLHDIFESLEDSCKPDRTINFNWTASKVGFGSFYFYEKDGILMCSNECMGKEFIKKMLCNMVDNCELDDPRDGKPESVDNT